MIDTPETEMKKSAGHIEFVCVAPGVFMEVLVVTTTERAPPPTDWEAHMRECAELGIETLPTWDHPTFGGQ